MPEWDDDRLDDETGELAPSKTALKREMLARQKLGESLLQLNENQLESIPIEDERLRQALHETRQIRSNSARRRHLQFIGKLMREVDPEPIERALQGIYQKKRESNEAFHELERLRDAILAAGVPGVEMAMERWPEADRQQLRQLILQHQRESRQGKPPAASRKLFRYLRECRELYGGED